MFSLDLIRSVVFVTFIARQRQHVAYSRGHLVSPSVGRLVVLKAVKSRENNGTFSHS